MESAAVYQTARACEIPCLSVRVISNNEITGEGFVESVAVQLQKFIWKTICE